MRQFDQPSTGPFGHPGFFSGFPHFYPPVAPLIDPVAVPPFEPPACNPFGGAAGNVFSICSPFGSTNWFF
jgi:hypothetical protein